jgi:hypothetical protein
MRLTLNNLSIGTSEAGVTDSFGHASLLLRSKVAGLHCIRFHAAFVNAMIFAF